jgi:hypothetical protein
MKLRTPLATIVREMSEISNLPVDILLEEAILQWADMHSSVYDHPHFTHRAIDHHGVLSLTRHEGCDS